MNNELARKIQLLLHKDYHGSKIIVFDNKFKYILHWMKEAMRHPTGIIDIIKLIYDDLYIVKSLGTYSDTTKESHILMFNIKKIFKEDLNWVASQVIVHELRHHYQNMINMKEDIREKDALKFGYRMSCCNKLGSKIMNLLET